MVSRRVLAAAALLGGAALGLAWGGGAQAHAALERAQPRVGSRAAAAPAEVRLWFSEPLEPAFSGAALLAPSGQPATAVKAVVDPKDRRELVIPALPPLAAGRYTVRWAVVSVDGHRTEGDFGFTVGR